MKSQGGIQMILWYVYTETGLLSDSCLYHSTGAIILKPVTLRRGSHLKISRSHHMWTALQSVKPLEPPL